MAPGLEPDRPRAEADLEEAVGRFEAGWRLGPRPTIDQFLPADADLRRPFLVELVHVDLELRLKAGEAARVEEYLTRFPELAADPDTAIDLIASEYELRRRQELGLTLDDYLRRFPQYAAKLPGRVAPTTVVGLDETPDTPAPTAAAVPAVAGYEIVGVAGRGGMGVVYRARQLSLDRPAALKFLPATWVRDPVWLERFRREAATASALNHPHICTIYDTGECDGRPYISMEWIDGQTLDALAGRCSVAEAARLLGQVARALAAAHAAGVVHRDVKPQNIMVRPDGIAKVLDFGLARRPADADTAAGTDPGTRVGTVMYMAPEQARAEVVDAAADIFALGVVAYELIAGRHPFADAGTANLLHAVATQEPLPPSRLNPEVPPTLDALVLHMLHKDARRRPTAVEVDAVLDEAVGQRGGDSQLRHLTTPQTNAPGRRFSVGREAERAVLRAAFDAAAAGRGSVVCVTGEPGLGKTTLVESLLAELAAEGRPVRLARGRCSDRLAGTEAYLPFLEALDGLLRGEDGPAAARAMKLLAPTWYLQLAPLAADDPALAPALAEAKDAPQERRKRELAAFLQEASRSRPLVLFLDDLHWADPSSVDLLAYVGDRCAGWRVLVALTYRPADLALSRHPFGPLKLDLQGRGICSEVALAFLDRADVDRYLAVAFAGHRFSDEFAAVLHARTGGNPLFLADLVRYLRDRGAIVADGGGWALTRAVSNVEGELPESVRGMIERQMGLLNEADRQLLAAASVQGLEFDAPVAARVLGLGVAEVEDRLDVLERVYALVRLMGEHEFPDGTLTLRYRFVHVLYQNALYSGLRPTRRAEWSAAAAQALLHYHGGTGTGAAAELALLFEAARDPDRAVEYFLLAAKNAVRVYAHREAVALAERGLVLLSRLPDAPDSDGRELALLLTLGVSLVATQGFASPNVEQTYDRARKLCRGPEDVQALFPALYGLWNVALLRCELTRCTDLAAQMLALAQNQPDPVFMLQAHNVLQQPMFHWGDFAAARRHQGYSLALYDRAKHRTLAAVYGEDPGVGCLLYGAVTLWCLGFPDQAVRSAREARARADDLANPFDVARCLYFGAFVRLCRREPARVRELADALASIARENGFALLVAGATIYRGWSLTETGSLAEGIALMRQGIADWQATGALSHRPYQLALLAQALARDGQTREGLTALDEGLALAASTGETFMAAELHRFCGELLLFDSAAVDEAEAATNRALVVARRQGALALELRALMSLTRRGCGDGRAALAEVYDRFAEGFDTPDMQEARALLGRGE